MRAARRALESVGGRRLLRLLGLASVIAAAAGAMLGSAASRGRAAAPAPVYGPSLGEAVPLGAGRLPRFTRTALGDGRTAQHAAACAGNVAGAAWADVDGDSHLDLYLPEPSGPGQLWLGRAGGRFVRGSLARAGIPAVAANAASFADVDNDGRPDLYLVARGRDRLLRNDGHGRFADITARSGTDDPGPGTSAAWADVDRDGLLDLYVTDGDNCGRPRLTPDRLYRNEGGGRFTDMTAVLERGGASTDGVGLHAAWLDIDRDGDQDLYLANDDLGFRANELWRNDTRMHGRWRFTPVARRTGADVALSSMGIGAGDLNGDGRQDLVISDMGRPPLVLLARRGGFARRRLPDAGGGVGPITWGTAVADVNDDGALDVLAAAGALGLDRDHQPDLLYLGDGHGRFRSSASVSGLGDPGRGRGAAVADIDRDGNLDVLITRLGQPPLLYRNRGPLDHRRAHWLELDLTGTRSPRDACGTRVIVTTSRRVSMTVLACGSDGSATLRHVVHLGLGSATRATVALQWPSGRRQTLTSVGADRVLAVVEPR